MSSLETIATWIWRISWQASVLVALVLLAQWLFGKKLAPAWRYGLWLLVVVRLLLPVAPGSPFSVFNWFHVASASQTAFRSPALNRPASHAEARMEPAPPEVAPATSAANGQKAAAAGVATASLDRPFRPKAILAAVWLAGVALFGAGLIWQYWRLRGRLADAVRVNDETVLQTLGEARHALGLRWSPTLFETDRVGSPALFGFLRIRLLLPTGLMASLSAQELRHVFLHEAAHLKRGDMLVNWLITFLQVLHWFNPILWFGFARLRADRELACDALALSHAREGEGKSYAQTIIKLLEGCAPPRSLPGLVGILEDKNQMKRRITMIAKFKSVRRWPVLALFLIVCLGLVALTDAQVGQASKEVPHSEKNKELKPAAQATNPSNTLNAASNAQENTTPTTRNLFGMALRRLVPPKYPGLYGPVKVSPDGRYLVYEGDKSEMSLFEIASQSIRKLAKADAGLSFSSDSTRVALVDGKQLRTMALDGSNPKTVFHDDKLKYIWIYAWSPDERWFAVEIEREANKYELALINASDGSLRLLKATGAREAGRAEFSPDSRFLVYDIKVDKEGTNSDLFVMDLESGREIPLVVHQADDRVLGWSPSSNAILFSSNRRGSHDAWVIQFAQGKPPGDPVLIKTDLGSAEPLGFTRSGAFYYSLTQFTEDVYTLALDSKTGKAKGVPVKAVERFEGYNLAPDWSPDGRFLAFNSARSPSVICIFDTQTQRARVLGEGLFGAKWSPDGTSLFAFSGWESEERRIYRVDVATGSRTVVVDAKPGGLFRSYHWSPDGRSIYYQYETGTNGSAIVRRDVATGNEQEIHRGGAFFAVSPDGRSIVFRDKMNSIYLIPATGGQPKLLTQFSGYYIPGWDAFTWSADGRSVLVCRWQRDRNAENVGDSIKSALVRVPMDGGDPETILEMPRIRYPSVHPDGSRISFSAGRPRSELWVMEDFLPNDRISSN